MICKNIYALVIGCACLSATATAATAWETLGLNGNVMTYSRLKKGANGLELTHKYTFDKNGLLVNVEDKTKGENISYKYNAEGEEVLRITTNADKIRAMTDEELMSIFQNMCCPYSLNMGGWKGNCEIETKGCGKCWLDWLKREGEV